MQLFKLSISVNPKKAISLTLVFHNNKRYIRENLLIKMTKQQTSEKSEIDINQFSVILQHNFLSWKKLEYDLLPVQLELYI